MNLSKAELLSKRIVHRMFLWLCLMLPLSACGHSGSAIDGKVVDVTTGTPITGAIVVALSEGRISMVVDSQGICLHVRSAVTDAQGNYHLPAWKSDHYKGQVTKRREYIVVYKEGYQKSEKKYDKYIKYLEPFTGTREERLEYLLRVSGVVSCGSQDESEKNLIPIFRSLYREAAVLAETNKDKNILEFILYDLEILELGFEEAERRHLARP